MKILIKCLWYLIKHKFYIFIGGLKYKVPIHLLILHDLDKFQWNKIKTYSNYWYGDKKLYREYLYSFNDHVHSSKHHWEHWILIDSVTVTLEMPEVYIREMLADFYSASMFKTGKDNSKDWYMKNKHKIRLHRNSRYKLEELLYG